MKVQKDVDRMGRQFCVFTAAQDERIVALYERGGGSARALAEDFGISPFSVRRRWERIREERAAAAVTAYPVAPAGVAGYLMAKRMPAWLLSPVDKSV